MEEAYFQGVKKVPDSSNLTGQRCPENVPLDSSDDKSAQK